MHANFTAVQTMAVLIFLTLSPRTSEPVRHAPDARAPLEQDSGDATDCSLSRSKICHISAARELCRNDKSRMLTFYCNRPIFTSKKLEIKRNTTKVALPETNQSFEDTQFITYRKTNL